eukprot:390577_1
MTQPATAKPIHTFTHVTLHFIFKNVLVYTRETMITLCIIALLMVANGLPRESLWYYKMNTASSDWSGSPWVISSGGSNCPNANGKDYCWDLKGGTIQWSTSFGLENHHTIQLTYSLSTTGVSSNKRCFLEYSTNGISFSDIYRTTGSNIGPGDHNDITFSFANPSSLSIQLTSGSGGTHCFMNEFTISGIPITSNPSAAPTRTPSSSPTSNPSAPTLPSSTVPSLSPSKPPSAVPSLSPTIPPTEVTSEPSASPTVPTTGPPTNAPSVFPTHAPIDLTAMPTEYTTADPTNSPSSNPTNNPTINPSNDPTSNPTFTPSDAPTTKPTSVPTLTPTSKPTAAPLTLGAPTKQPTASTDNPTHNPTLVPTLNPTKQPTDSPTVKPTLDPTQRPTNAPQAPGTPTKNPTSRPTNAPQTSTNPTSVIPSDTTTIDPTTSTTRITAVPTRSTTIKPSSTSTRTWTTTLDLTGNPHSKGNKDVDSFDFIPSIIPGVSNIVGGLVLIVVVLMVMICLCVCLWKCKTRSKGKGQIINESDVFSETELAQDHKEKKTATIAMEIKELIQQGNALKSTSGPSEDKTEDTLLTGGKQGTETIVIAEDSDTDTDQGVIAEMDTPMGPADDASEESESHVPPPPEPRAKCEECGKYSTGKFRDADGSFYCKPCYQAKGGTQEF